MPTRAEATLPADPARSLARIGGKRTFSARAITQTSERWCRHYAKRLPWELADMQHSQAPLPHGGRGRAAGANDREASRKAAAPVGILSKSRVVRLQDNALLPIGYDQVASSVRRA